MKRNSWGSRLFALALATSAAALVAACDEQVAGGPSGRSLRPIPNDTIALMEQKDTTPSAPVLIRTYKKEAEFEIWKLTSSGRYTLLKTYPMCRWSGQLGPKVREGDRQVPEGFYTITPGQMNPNSNYYLSFNVGYPNSYDRAWGRTGGNIMVHGICSSAGCFSMTDNQIAEIYAIAREAFNGGQREIQMQSYPFHMTAENLAKYRLDPNMAFWKQLKTGADHFEVTKTEPTVGVCAKHYVFDAKPDHGALEASAPCPTLERDDQVETAVNEKEARDDVAVAELVKQGVKPIETVYIDGGQNESFHHRVADVSAPEALESAPQEIALDDHGKPLPVPAAVKVAATDAARAAAATTPAAQQATTPAQQQPATPAQSAASAGATAAVKVAVQGQPPAAAPAQPAASGSSSALTSVLSAADSSGSAVKKWLHFGASSSDSALTAVQPYEPAEPIPSDVPLPPKRNAAANTPAAGAAKPQASLHPTSGTVVANAERAAADSSAH
jgi:murein L,D-transpeptidase YafK